MALLGALSGVENPAAKIDAAVDKLQRWQARVDNPSPIPSPSPSPNPT